MKRASDAIADYMQKPAQTCRNQPSLAKVSGGCPPKPDGRRRAVARELRLTSHPDHNGQRKLRELRIFGKAPQNTHRMRVRAILRKLAQIAENPATISALLSFRAVLGITN